MKTTLKSLPASQVLLTVELDSSEWEKYRLQALKKLSSEVKIDGFRTGHIPEKVLLEKIGTEVIMAETVDIALPQCYTEAVTKEKVRPIAQPDVKITAQEPFTFEVTISVYPDIEVKEITKIKAKKEIVKVSKKEVDDMMEYFQKQIAEKKDVDRTSKKGDTAIIDFAGFDKDGVALDGTQGKHHPVEIGSNTMIPGFEDELIGLKKGEKKSFEITFPKDYHAKKFAAKKVRFEITVHHVQETILPEINEEFVKKITGSEKSVEDLRKEIEDSLKEKKENEQRRQHEGALLEAVAGATKGDLPAVLIDEEVEYLIDNMKMQGLQQGITWENQLIHLKKSEDEIKKEVRGQAETQVRIRMGVQKFLEVEKVEVPKEEIEAEAARSFARLGEEDKIAKADMFQEGGRAWNEAENRLRVSVWIEKKLSALVK